MFLRTDHPGASIGASPYRARVSRHPSQGSRTISPLFSFGRLPYCYGAGQQGSSGYSSARRGMANPQFPRLTVASLACLLATFINPYGWRLHEHVLAYLENDYVMDHISEFRSFSFHSPGALYVELFLAVAALGTISLFRQRAFGPALLSVGMLHLSLYSARHLPTAAVLVLPLSVPALSREARTWPAMRRFLDYSDRLRAIDSRIYGIVPIMLLLASRVAGVNALSGAGRIWLDPGTFTLCAPVFPEQRTRSPAGSVRV